jgi:hypothetical protein
MPRQSFLELGSSGVRVSRRPVAEQRHVLHSVAGDHAFCDRSGLDGETKATLSISGVTGIVDVNSRSSADVELGLICF